MTEREGVIRFQLDFTPGPPPSPRAVAELDAWRSILFRLQLVGRDPDRYHGLGFGNVSCRDGEAGFLVSATQTGHAAVLGPGGYCRITACDPRRNHVVATGPAKPSSEALSHAAVYAARPRAACVLHGHSPDIWQAAERLGLPVSDPAVPYGTPEMAAEVDRLCREALDADAGLFVMGGHEDGVMAYGPDPETAGLLLVRTLAAALAQGLPFPESAYPSRSSS